MCVCVRACVRALESACVRECMCMRACTLGRGLLFALLFSFKCIYFHFCFRFATCRRQWQSCPKEHGRIQVRQGDTRSDTLCRCLWEESYIPSRRMSECLSLDGFSDEANCHCVHKKCPAGQRVNKGERTHMDVRSMFPKHDKVSNHPR